MAPESVPDREAEGTGRSQSAGPRDAGLDDGRPPILGRHGHDRSPLRHRHPADRRDAPGDGQRRGRRRRPAATTPRSTRSRSAPPTCSARKPACSCRAGPRAISSPSWPISPGARRRSPQREPHRHRRGRRPRSHRRDDRSDRSASDPTGRSIRPRSTSHSAIRATPTSRSRGMVAIENTHAHSMGQPLSVGYTAEVAASPIATTSRSTSTARASSTLSSPWA